MNRQLSWAMLIALGMALGWAMSHYERTHAAPSVDLEIAADQKAADQDAADQNGTDKNGADKDAPDQSAEIVVQLKEINEHLMRIDALLHSGRLTVIDAINADIAP